jgi:hypothetical protein
MSVFPVLDYEERLQLGDKTRMNAEKCFVAPLSETAIATLTITPGLDGSAQNVYSATTEDRYLDWIFNTQGFDVVTGVNDNIDFDQSGEKSATLTQGTYTLTTLLAHIVTKLNAVIGISGTFSASSDINNKITITNDTASFELLPETGDNRASSILKHIGFRKNISGSSVVSDPVEYSMKQITVTANNGSGAQTLTKYIHLYSVQGDALFSTDQDLITWEPSIMQWVQRGRSSFLNIHREAQDQMMYWLDKQGYTNVYQEKFRKFDLLDVTEVSEWSAFLTLSIIFWGISNKVDDVFLNKHFEYLKKAQEARDRAVLRIDVDKDGVLDIGEQVDIKFGQIVTR